MERTRRGFGIEFDVKCGFAKIGEVIYSGFGGFYRYGVSRHINGEQIAFRKKRAVNADDLAPTVDIINVVGGVAFERPAVALAVAQSVYESAVTVLDYKTAYPVFFIV